MTIFSPQILLRSAPLRIGSEVSVTWNPSDKGANITLSNGNLSASGATSYNSVRATQSRASGLYYWENLCSAVAADTSTSLVGFGDGSFSLTNFVGGSAASVGIEVFNGGTDANGFTSAVATGVTWATNDVVNLAADLDAGKIWIGKNGTWTSGSPAAGTSPNITYTAPKTLFPAWSSPNGTNTGTARFLLASFTGTVPSGFKSWATP